MNIDKYFATDIIFNKFYSPHIRSLADRHWTSLLVAEKAAHYLTMDGNVKVLDIGSGVGKFCLAAAYYKPNSFFYGVEQRESLVHESNRVNDILQLKNVAFIHQNITETNFALYNHFYFYNSFYENLNDNDKIDDAVTYSSELYHNYNRYVYKQLEQQPTGTRLATYFSSELEVPSSFLEVYSEMDDALKFWIKL
ncbi:MAG: class I SAM-dependent methyltransferase [Chitinophagaceae bacterium]|jgi:predicted RNA methylase|nr:class I SAM-dependent methyltransferase [Chitinophagaceae bacterium]